MTHTQLEEDIAGVLAERSPALNVPGVAAGVWWDGAETIVCHGVTSTADPAPVQTHTPFLVGSTTKTVTATAIMTQVQAGVLSLDDPVVAYLPHLRLPCPDDADRLTVGHLLDHTAGWIGDVTADTGFGDDALALAIPRIVSDAVQLTRPGTVMAYNNAAVALAGRLLEVLTGSSYEAASRELVLDPLGMSESWLLPWEVAQRGLAVGHAVVDGKAVPDPDWPLERWCTPAGGLASSVRDQLRYARFHLDGGPPLSDEIRLSMRAPRVTARSGVEGVGVSWLLNSRGDTPLLEHGGNVSNLHLSSFTLVPSERLAVIVLTNSVGGRQIGEEVLDLVLSAAGVPSTPPLTTTELDSRAAAEYVGTYAAGQWSLVVDVDDRAGLRVRMEIPDASAFTEEERAGFDADPTPLAPVGADVFVDANDPKRPIADFIRDDSGAVRFLRHGLRLARRAES